MSSLSQPEKPMSLVDEIDPFTDWEVQNLIHFGDTLDVAEGVRPFFYALADKITAHKSRLTAIETELNDLRHPHFCDECGLPMALIDNPFGAPGKNWNCYNPECDYTAPIEYRLPDPPRVLSHKQLMEEVGEASERIAAMPLPPNLDMSDIVEHPSGLPCSNVSDWDDETGG
jgi:hypothetical protein